MDWWHKIGRTVATLFMVYSWWVTTAVAQTGTWRAYMAYQEAQQIVKGDNRLYVRASNDLYSYNLDDQSIVTYDKISQLTDNFITHIGWNERAKKLVIVYQNSNIDLLDGQDNVTNVSSLYLKSMTQDKTVNDVLMNGVFAYIATNFGVVKLNVSQALITESYVLNKPIAQLDIRDNKLYARTADTEYLQASLSKNLINPANWETPASMPEGLFEKDQTDWNTYHELVETLQPGGPTYNHFGAMRFKHNKLYTVPGGYNCVAEMNYPGLIQMLDSQGEWSFLGSDVATATGRDFVDVDDIDVDAADANHIFISGKTGLYEFKDGAFAKEYTFENSPLSSTLGNSHPSAKRYTLVEGISFDAGGNLWSVNAGGKTSTILKLDGNGEWTSYNPTELIDGSKGLKGLQQVFCDSRGYVWFINFHWVIPSWYCFDPSTGKLLSKWVSPVKNQDGAEYLATPRCITEDKNHNIWIGTDVGPFLIEASQTANGQENVVTQVKVPRNDGTDLADYLMAGIVVRSIVVDGGNRKWIGTQGKGVYLISADNNTELEHFTTENSPLLSDNIESMAWNPTTGELFIGTDQGLCSYMTDATTSVSDPSSDNAYAFPNPVPSGYQGLITVRGLSADSDVRVVTTSGRLVAQGRSNGGTFTWNGLDRQGRRVASGVYMIMAANSNGEKGAVVKVAIIR